MKKVLITGATGFVGHHLVNFLSDRKDLQIFGTSLSKPEQANKEMDIHKVDLSDYGSVVKLVDNIKPDYVYHLAALTSTADSFNNPTPVVVGNIEIQMNLLNALKNLNLTNSRILVVSSGEVYGVVDKSDLPIDEDTPLRPCTPYAVSKLAQDFLGLQYYLSYRLQIIRVRAFNHTGPNQPPAFAIPAFARQIAQIEKGQQEPVVKVGDLSAKKDFSDVRDIVEGYSKIMEMGDAGDVYNIGSGKSYKIKDLLDILLSLSDKKIEIVEDPSKLRPTKVGEVYCDYTKLNKKTEWAPKISIEKTLKDTLDYWRSVV